MRNKTELSIVAVCSVMIVSLLIINYAVGTFFRYYSMISVSDDDDYSDVLLSLSDSDVTDSEGVQIELPGESVFSSKDVINILMIGTDERTEEFNKASRADSIMLLSLDKLTHDVRLVSFERDMYVAIPKVPKRNPDKLGHTFRFGGAKLLMETLRTHFGLDVAEYVRVNFSVFKKLVDEIGGVDIVLTKAEAYEISSRTDSTVKEGKNHLNGEAALCYSRIRKLDSDWQRVKRQQNVIVAIKNNLSKKNMSELKGILDACLPYVQTNLSPYDCAVLLLNIADYAKGNVSRMTIPRRRTFSDLNRVSFKANSDILRKFLYNN